MQTKVSSICFILFILIFLQSCGIKKRIQKADKHYNLGEYYMAGNLYKNAYKKIPAQQENLRAEVAFKQAECYRKTNNNRTLFVYQNAIRNKYPDCIVFLHYAQVLQQNQKYNEAITNYEKYLECDPENSVAKNGLLAAKKIAEWKENPTRYKIRKEKELNERRYSSFSPAFMGTKSDMLVFTSSRSNDKKSKEKRSAISGMPPNKLYSIKKNNSNKWEKPSLLDPEINLPEAENGVSSFSADGSKMYFTRSGKNDSLPSAVQIWHSTRAGGTWSEARMLKIFKDSTINVAHPAISPDGTTLFFTSDAPGGFGGKDIWKASLENGEFKYIENLGSDINTEGDEMFPSVKSDGTLFFSSNGHLGFGGLDIYKATLDEENKKEDRKNKWLVENMGFPLNSPTDDFGISFDGSNEKGFFSSNREGKQGYDMIWSFELPAFSYSVEGKVFDDKGEAIPNPTIRLVGTDGTNARIQAKKDGSYHLGLEKGVDYVMLASARGHLNQSKKLSTAEAKESESFRQDFNLSSIFEPVQLENIYYEFAKWDLRPESEAGLQVLLKMLKDNPNVTIELSAHTDYIGDEEQNKNLSKKRAQVVVDYLIKNGVDSKRLTPIGQGKEKPFVVDANTEKKYSFLKTGEELTKELILGLTEEQQKIANQINRRTEFRVLTTTYNLY